MFKSQIWHYYIILNLPTIKISDSVTTSPHISQPFFSYFRKRKEGRMEGVGWEGRRRKILNGNFIILHICKLKIRVEVQLLIRSRTGSMGCFSFSIFFPFFLYPFSLSFLLKGVKSFLWKGDLFSLLVPP